MMNLRHRGSRPVTARLWQRAAQNPDPLEWQVAEEVAVGMLLNARPLAVVMATPVDLKDLGVGFVLSEQYVKHPGAIKGVVTMRTESGFCVDVSADPAAVRSRPARAMEARSGCGLCGLNALTDVTLEVPHRDLDTPSARAIARAFMELGQHQPMKAVNHSVHAAGFADGAGHVTLVREDVGRHNALDKLIGVLAGRGHSCSGGFAVMTSRCSFELVQKAATVGFAALATMSAPTQLALDTARAAGLPLASCASNGIAVFDGRIE